LGGAILEKGVIMRLDLTFLGPKAALSAIYIGYFERAADPEGLNFWTGVYESQTLSLAEIAADFATQPEASERFAFLTDPTREAASDLITDIYESLFNRPPDAEGLAFWIDVLIDQSSAGIGDFILEVIAGAQDLAQGNDLTTILNKIEVAVFWTNSAEAAGLDYLSSPALQESARSTIRDVTDETPSPTPISEPFVPFFQSLSEANTQQDGARFALDEPLEMQIGLIGLSSSPHDTF
jgi:hypothetical protein